MPAGLIALALGGFGIGLTEFNIMGLLPEVAATFGVSEAVAGALITGYALAVIVGALGLTAATTRLPRKRVLLGLLVLFVVGNAISAAAPTYEVMMTGRIVAALCHGAFFGIGSVVAASLVDPSRKAAAVAIMFTGLTTATVLGVPLGTFVGQQFGWRATFWVITVIGVVALLGVLALVPADRGRHQTTRLRDELGAFRDRQVWLSMAETVLGFGGMFGAFTYIAYTLTVVSGFAASTVPWLLVLFGAGLLIGNVVGGRFADRALDRSLLVILGALVLVLVAFALVAPNPIATAVLLFGMGGFGFATVPGLQTRVMTYAAQAPSLASAGNIAAFNLGNALGAWLGGITISVGLGFTAPIWTGAGLTAGALLVMAVAARTAPRPPVDHAPPAAVTRG
ncbi:MFS transporter [Nakamurella sp.]|uniref:MFS transporter n=1 Tax=Nakamurella sp. TaxID=1869182 RepID=UPI003B3A8C80